MPFITEDIWHLLKDLFLEFSRPEYWSGLPFPSPGDLPNPGIEPRSPTLQADSSPAEPQGKPENTGVGSLSFLQRIFPTQGSNLGLLHCRQILYCLSHQGHPSDGQTINHWKWTPSNHLPNGPSLVILESAMNTSKRNAIFVFVRHRKVFVWLKNYVFIKEECMLFS